MDVVTSKPAFLLSVVLIFPWAGLLPAIMGALKQWEKHPAQAP